MSKEKMLAIGSNAARMDVGGGGAIATGHTLNETVVLARGEQ
jgi:hypothetical protein